MKSEAVWSIGKEHGLRMQPAEQPDSPPLDSSRVLQRRQLATLEEDVAIKARQLCTSLAFKRVDLLVVETLGAVERLGGVRIKDMLGDAIQHMWGDHYRFLVFLSRSDSRVMNMVDVRVDLLEVRIV